MLLSALRSLVPAVAITIAVYAVSATPSASAQAVADSTSAAVADTSIAAMADSSSAASDSLLAAGSDSTAASVDSLVVAATDSVAVIVPEGPLPGGVSEPTALGGAWLASLRAETLEDVVEAIPGAVVRVAGDTGMPAYVGISPISGSHPEIWMDGIPTRSPADLDPGLWDRSAIAVERVGRYEFGPAPGDPGLWMESHDPRPGILVLRSRFSSTSAETYQRGLSATTPASGRVLRFDFEEWKTEEGIEYSGAPGVLGRSDAGRSKMRRFRMGGDVTTDVGRLRMFFGRGRRYYRGSVLDANARERWTGELSVAFDRASAVTAQSVRAWHLDFSDDDRGIDQQLDASRTGLSVEHRPVAAGVSAQASVERWSARYAPDDTTVVGPRAALVARARAGWTADPGARVRPWFWVETAHADHLDDAYGLGGRAGVVVGEQGRGLRLVGERLLRVPSLAETDGRFGIDAVQPLGAGFTYQGTTWQWRGTSDLSIERQARVGATLFASGARWQVDASIDHWRLRDGVGWRPQDADVARVVGDAELDVTQATGRAQLLVDSGTWSLRGFVQGQRVLGGLDPDAGRGGGWPDWNLRARLSTDRRFFSRLNRLGIDLDVAGLGPRADDVVAPLTDLVLPTRWRLDAAVRLRIRSAVLSVGYDNLLDTEQDEVLGTFRRGRQLRWQLDWTFTN